MAIRANRAQERPRSPRVPLVGGALFILAAVVASGWLGLQLLHPGQQRTVDRSSPVVLQAIDNVSTFKAATGNFQVVVDLEKDFKMVPAFIAGKRSIMVAQGSVDAEVDLSHLSESAVHVSDDRRSVDITLPAAQLSATHLDNGKTYVAERQRGLLNRVGEAFSSNPGDDQALLQAADAKLRQAADNTALRQRAEDNTRAMLTQLMTSLGFRHINVHFDAPVQP